MSLDTLQESKRLKNGKALERSSRTRRTACRRPHHFLAISAIGRKFSHPSMSTRIARFDHRTSPKCSPRTVSLARCSFLDAHEGKAKLGKLMRGAGDPSKLPDSLHMMKEKGAKNSEQFKQFMFRYISSNGREVTRADLKAFFQETGIAVDVISYSANI